MIVKTEPSRPALLPHAAAAADAGYPSCGVLLKAVCVVRPSRSAPCLSHLEAYPEGVLLRVRVDGHTVLLVSLSTQEASMGRSSPEGLKIVTLERLCAAGL